MVLGGDELSRTQGGNNNAYCQDNEVNYYDWDLDERERAFLDFVREAVAFRRRHPSFRRRQFLSGEAGPGGVKDALWWHPDGREMTGEDWEQPGLDAFGVVLRGDAIEGVDRRGRPRTDDTFLLLFNKGDGPAALPLPTAEAGDPDGWEPAAPFDEGVELDGGEARVPARSLVVLRARTGA